MSLAFGTGPSNGQFWFGGSTFPGFMFKKNNGVGGRRSTKMNPGGNITCNGPSYLYNKYTPGASGIGASSMSNRRAKNRLATVCRSGDGNTTANCFPCQPTLGQYSNYTHNPNGYYPCITLPAPIPISPIPPCPEKICQGGQFTTNSELEVLRGCTSIIGDLIISPFDGQPDFSVFDCLTTITASFIVSNSSLYILGFNKLTTIGGDLFIHENPNLTVISDFPSLTTINGNLIITGNPSLISVTGFNALKSIFNAFAIYANSMLTSINGFNTITTIGGSLYIISNTDSSQSYLNSISGFKDLIPNGNTNSSFIAANNYLPFNTSICLSTYNALINYYSTNITISDTITNNLC